MRKKNEIFSSEMQHIQVPPMNKLQHRFKTNTYSYNYTQERALKKEAITPEE